MRRAATGAALVVLVLGIGGIFVPFLAAETEPLVGTPIPPPLPGREHIVPLSPGGSLCLDSVAVSPSVSRARLAVGTYGGRGEALSLTLTGLGYRSSSRVPAGYGDNSSVELSVTNPRRELLAVACIRNAGRNRVAFYGTAPQHEASRPSATTAGRLTAADPTFVFLDERRETLATRLPEAIGRTALFRPGGKFVAWLVALAAVVGILGGPFLAFHFAGRDPS